MSIQLRNGKWEFTDADIANVGWTEARNIVATADNILFSTSELEVKALVGTLRDNLQDASSMDDAIEGSKTLRQQLKEVLKAFNALNLPSSRPTQSPTPPPPTAPPVRQDPTPAPDPAPAPQDPEPASTPSPTPPAAAGGGTLADRVQDLENRADGHDRRHENAEANLTALNGAVGIAKNPDGAWVPTPDGQFDRNSRVQQHLGYDRDRDGSVTFTDRTVTVDGQPYKYGIAVIVLVVVLILGYLIVGAIAGWFSIPALIVVPAISLVAAGVALLVTNKN